MKKILEDIENAQDKLLSSPRDKSGTRECPLCDYPLIDGLYDSETNEHYYCRLIQKARQRIEEIKKEGNFEPANEYETRLREIEQVTNKAFNLSPNDRSRFNMGGNNGPKI
ncbi:hypothetical protein MMIC_P1723 [Mariprofundus micogutta]|uniref:Uncharacterized protein n=1 Tax=Mariprofundus micogutta TaxID=1921010 RepID=A0A1L8CPA3_9PROT|nr:hypothetical protein [Mariprofundus micogutta]GAV20750.1 hypothetical protein MMIC_P1723 [Mariprofundus micogutta]